MDTTEDIGLYDDLNCVDLGELVSKLENDKEILSKQIRTLEGDVERLVTELECMKETQKSLSRNISELYKTAKNEIERKDRMIDALRTEKDNLLFRRANRATEERQVDDHVKRIKREDLDENPSKRRKCENETHSVKREPARHSPRRRTSSDSRDHKDRHHGKDSHRHRDSGSGSSRRNHGNESNDRNRSRYHIKGEDNDRNDEQHRNNSKQSSDKFKHNSVNKQDFTKESSREIGRNENRKHESASTSTDRKRKYDSGYKSTIEKENDRYKGNDSGKNNTPSRNIHTNTRNVTDDASSKSMDCDNSSHLKNGLKGEDKSSTDRKKYQLIPFSFFDKPILSTKDKNIANLPQAMDCEEQLNSKTLSESIVDKIEETSLVVDSDLRQRINQRRLQSSKQEDPIIEKENLISPRHDNLMNYLEIQPKKEKVISDDCEKKLKSKTSTKEKYKSKIEKKRNPTTSRASDGRNRSEKESKSGSNVHKVTTKDEIHSRNSDKSSSKKYESKEIHKRRDNLNSESTYDELDDSFIHMSHLRKERERIKRDLEQLDDSDEDTCHSTDETSSLETDDAKVMFLANVNISPVIKAKKGATNRLQECIEKLGEREHNSQNVVTSNENPEEDNKIVPTKNENAVEVTSSYLDDSIGSPTSSSNQIITKKTPRLANLIDKLSAKEPNCSKYDVFEESANEVAHSTLKFNDCQLSSINTTIIEENVINQPSTSAMNDSNLVLPKLTRISTTVREASNFTTVKPQLPLTEATNNNSISNSPDVNLVNPLETTNTVTIEPKTTNNNSEVLDKSKTDSVDPNISSSSERLNNSNSTIVLSSNLSLNNSSDNNSSVRTVFNNRRRRCVVKIVN